MAVDLDPIWKALSDPTRRRILELLKAGPRLTGEVVEQFPELSRFAVMKHLDQLRGVGLVVTEVEGRKRVNRLNPEPIQRVYEQWVRRFSDHWSTALGDIKSAAESTVKP